MDDDRPRAESDDAIEAALGDLASGHPDATFAAINSSAALIPVPASIALPSGAPMAAGTMIDLVAPADRAVVARLWGHARIRGTAVSPIRIQGPPERKGHLYLFDLRSRHGVVIVAFVDGDAQPQIFPDDASRPARPPRFATCTKDAVAVYRTVDVALTQMLGWDAEEIVGRRAIEFIHPDDAESGIANWMAMLDSADVDRGVRLRHRHRDGSWMWLEVTNHNRLAEPDHGDVLTEMVDISEEMAAMEALRAREQLLAQLTDTVPVGLFHADTDGCVLFTNRRLDDMTGITAATTLSNQFSFAADGDRPALDDALRIAGGGTESDLELDLRVGGDTVRHCKLSLRPLVDDDGRVSGVTGCLEDVTSMVRSRRALEAKAAIDALTGCLNREAILHALQRRLAADTAGTAVLFLDLDGFKQINDDLGHAAGDDYLVSVAARIRAAIRAADLLGRFGGDEFLVVCPDVPGPLEALELARSLTHRAFEAGPGRDGAPPIRASIGVAWTASPGAATALIQAADAAMYESKRAGRGEPALAQPLARMDA